MINDSNNNYAEFATFKRTTASHKFKPQGKVIVLSNLINCMNFMMIGLEFKEDIFKNILME